MESDKKRIALIVLVLAEVGLAALTWRDIRNRPAEEIREFFEKYGEPPSP